LDARTRRGAGRQLHRAGPSRGRDAPRRSAAAAGRPAGRHVMPLRVLVADDHPLFREGLRTVLEASEDLVVVAEAADGDEAVRLALSESIDVALFDVHMPGLDGIAATARVHAARPAVRVLVLTMFRDDASIFAALRAGARGYV